MLDLGIESFNPVVGDQFQILTSFGNVSGAFANNPTSYANGQTYNWDVIYQPNFVQIRLASTAVPEPTMATILAPLFVGVLLRRRRAKK